MNEPMKAWQIIVILLCIPIVLCAIAANCALATLPVAAQIDLRGSIGHPIDAEASYE